MLTLDTKRWDYLKALEQAIGLIRSGTMSWTAGVPVVDGEGCAELMPIVVSGVRQPRDVLRVACGDLECYAIVASSTPEKDLEDTIRGALVELILDGLDE